LLSGNLKSNIENLKWVGIVALVVTLVICGAVAQAQEPKKIPRIGLLSFGTAEAARSRQQAFLEGLRDLGWIEGQNIAIERRYANESRNQLLDTAAELVRLRVDVIVALDSVAIRPAMEATKTIPIVMAVSGGPRRNRFDR
jgi:putative ABC transport system substrate-binding protein